MGHDYDMLSIRKDAEKRGARKAEKEIAKLREEKREMLAMLECLYATEGLKEEMINYDLDIALAALINKAKGD